MTDLISNAAAAAAINAAENTTENVVFDADNFCEVSSTKGKILAFFLSLPRGEKKSASDVLDETKLSNGEGSPVIRQLYVAGILSQECRRGKYSIADGVIILPDSKIEKSEDGKSVVKPVYKWAGNKPIPCPENNEKGASKKSKKSLTASEIFEAFRENLSAEFQQALKVQLDALEKGIQAEEEKAAAAAEEAAIEAEIKKLEEEAAERRRRLEELRGKKA